MQNRCIDCNQPFDVPEEQASWRVRCNACYGRYKRAQGDSGGGGRGRYWSRPARPSESDTAGEIAKLRGEVASLREELAKREAETELSPEVLRLLLQMSHPDRHGGSKASHKATRYLLAKLRELKDATTT